MNIRLKTNLAWLQSTWIFSILLGVLCAFLMKKEHEPTGYFTHDSELWADMAGYYVYLPAAFIYDFDGTAMDPEMPAKTGGGFDIDPETGKIFTKYSIGVAMLQAPFFLSVHASQHITGGVTDGFSGAYHNVPTLAAWFYTVMGFWFFFTFIRRIWGVGVAWLVSLMVFLGTNVLYYSVVNTGMSHIYSFCLFAAFLYGLSRLPGSGRAWLFTGLIAGLILAVRPLNLLFILVALLWFLQRGSLHIKDLLTRKILIMAFAAILMLFPQLVYWHYLTGNWVYYSYGNEGFSNALHPDLTALWFAPNNGLILYNPVYLLVIVAMIWLVVRNVREGLIFSLSFLSLSYLLASWHIPYFGCSYGSRNFVEYSVFFFLPLAGMLAAIRRWWVKGIFLLIALACILYNTKLMYHAIGCFKGETTWEWSAFKDHLLKGFFHLEEPQILVNPSDKTVGLQVFFIPEEASRVPFEVAEVSMKVDFYTEGDKAQMVFHAVSGDSTLVWSPFKIRKAFDRHNSKGVIFTNFILPEHYDANTEFKFYIWNLGQDSLRIQDFNLWLK